MTEEIEAGGAGPQIENADDFAKWLAEVRPAPDVCVALAARAALRALPLIQYSFEIQEGEAEKIEILRNFSGIAASLITAKYPATAINLSDDIFKIWRNSINESPPAIASISIYVQLAIKSTELAASYFCLDTLSSSLGYYQKVIGSTIEAIDFAFNAINYALQFNPENTTKNDVRDSFKFGIGGTTRPKFLDNEAKNAEIFFWQSLEKDLRLISSSGWSVDVSEKPLWHEKPPELVSNYWRILSSYLPDSDGWRVWKNWYEDRLNGKTQSEAHDMIYATVPEEEWEKGPAAANAWIAAELAKLEKNTPDSFTDAFEKLTLQDPHGASFEIVEGKARIAESLNENDAKVAGDPQTTQLHARVKIRANNARERVRRLANQPGFESIAATVEEYYNYISDDTLSVAANISTVWELSVAIGSFIERDDEIRAGRGGMVSEMEADARETLDQLVIASAPFVRRFPTARQNDEDVRLFKQSRTSFDSAKRIFKHAANENLIEDKSNLTINIAINAAEISSGIQSEKSVSWINSTARNLIAVLILPIALGLWAVKISGEEFIKKFTDDIYDNSITTKKILNFARKRENDFYGAYSDSPPDLKAAHKEIMQELKKSLQSEKHHRK